MNVSIGRQVSDIPLAIIHDIYICRSHRCLLNFVAQPLLCGFIDIQDVNNETYLRLRTATFCSREGSFRNLVSARRTTQPGKGRRERTRSDLATGDTDCPCYSHTPDSCIGR